MYCVVRLCCLLRNLFLAVIVTLLLALWAGPAGAQALLDWPRGDVEALVQAVEEARAEGLKPADYKRDALHHALASGDARQWSVVATSAALALGNDYRAGRVPEHRRGWHMGTAADMNMLLSLVGRSLGTGRIGEALRSLLPQHPDYQALKAALAATPPDDRARIARLRANLERWRWMPRFLGERHILVNVPAYRLRLVENGVTIDERDVIVGKPSTPTDLFATSVSGVVFNPWWNVPPSLEREKLALLAKRPSAARRAGYSVVRAPDGVRVQQKPGPANALGRMKLVMANRFDIYLHDTPEKHLFAKPQRAFSQGCVRVKDPLDFAALLLRDNGDWDAAHIDRAVASGRTTNVTVAAPLPIYIAYFTAEADASGTVRLLGDPYKQDEQLIQALDGAQQLADIGGE